MKTMEEHKKEKIPRYIKSEELEKHLNSEEMRELMKKLENLSEYKKKTKNVSVGQY